MYFFCILIFFMLFSLLTIAKKRLSVYLHFANDSQESPSAGDCSLLLDYYFLILQYLRGTLIPSGHCHRDTVLLLNVALSLQLNDSSESKAYIFLGNIVLLHRTCESIFFNFSINE